jgi:hypothetical protein
MTAHRNPRRRLVDMATADQEFDELIPAELRHLSRTQWTPVEVAIRAATLLSPAPAMRILDVGSGVGKLCTVGALSAPSAWCGVEQHEGLVHAARRLSRIMGAGDNTIFVHGDAFSVDWETFDALYFYNPFELQVDPTAAPRDEREYRVQVARTEDRLAGLPEGMRVVTLHGFGGIMPASYRLVYQERIPIMGLDLVLWIQRAAGRRMVRTS